MILELINRRNFNLEFPFPLFFLMWLLAASFTFIIMPVARELRRGTRSLTDVVSLMSRAVLAILIAWFWVGLVADQMPCFLGVPNCD